MISAHLSLIMMLSCSVALHGCVGHSSDVVCESHQFEIDSLGGGRESPAFFEDSPGKSAVECAERLIGQGDADVLGQFVARALRGDALDETAAQRFGPNVAGATTPEQEARAARLGYAAAVVGTAFANRSNVIRDGLGSDAEAAADVLTQIVPEQRISREGAVLRIDGREVAPEEAGYLVEDWATPRDLSGDKYSHEIQRAYDGSRTLIRQSFSR